MSNSTVYRASVVVWISLIGTPMALGQSSGGAVARPVSSPVSSPVDGGSAGQSAGDAGLTTLPAQAVTEVTPMMPDLATLAADVAALQQQALEHARNVSDQAGVAAARDYAERLSGVLGRLESRLDALTPEQAQALTGEAARQWQRLRAAREVESGNQAVSPEIIGPDERENVALVNDYRRRLGLPLLSIDEKLVEAARSHSREMNSLGYFAHESPTSGQTRVTDRVSSTGYDWRAVAENIARGPDTARGAFDLWFASPGHHRNMVGDYADLGVGRSGAYWAQNFATPMPPRSSWPTHLDSRRPR